MFDVVKVVKRAYKYRFYPTPEQAGLLVRTFGCVRWVWNRALAERSRAWTQEQKRVTFADTCRMLTQWKQDPETAWLYEVSNVALQQGLQHLQNAYVNFWGKRGKYPKFKSKHKSRAAATFTTSGFRYRDGRITLAKMDAPLNIRWSRPLPEGAEPSTVTVSRDPAGRWFVSLLCQCAVGLLPAGHSVVGVDAGITSLATLSTGRRSPIPGTSARTGPGSRWRSGGWPAPRRAPRTGTRPGSRWRGSMPGSATADTISCTSSAADRHDGSVAHRQLDVLLMTTAGTRRIDAPRWNLAPAHRTRSSDRQLASTLSGSYRTTVPAM